MFFNGRFFILLPDSSWQFMVNIWWTSESPRAYVGQLRLIRSVWEHTKFPSLNWLKLKMGELITQSVVNPIWLQLVCHFWASIFNCFVLLMITEEGSVPEMRIWSKLLIAPDLKWYIHLSRSLFLKFYLWSNFE